MKTISIRLEDSIYEELGAMLDAMEHGSMTEDMLSSCQMVQLILTYIVPLLNQIHMNY